MLRPANDAQPLPDNRRATVRIVAHEILEGLASLARLNGGDMVRLIVFTGIWTANSQHLVGGDRYAALHDIPPDSQHRPVPQDALATQIAMPADIVSRYVEALIAEGLVERLPAGLVVPSAVFGRPDMLDGSSELYARFMSMVVALRAAGFQFGEGG